MQAKQPLISVVMATYNGEKFLADQLNSIIEQSHKNIEIIVADDASSDGTRQILSQFSKLDKRIRIIQKEHNAGQKGNLEDAFRLVNGEYIAIADQDDIWLPDKLEVLMKNIGGSSAIYSNSEMISADGSRIGIDLLRLIKRWPPIEGTSFWPLIHKNCVSGHALLFKRDLLEIALPFNKEQRSMFDHQLSLAATIKEGLKFIPDHLVLHRSHDSNQTNAFFKDKIDKSLVDNRKLKSARANNEHWRITLTIIIDLLNRGGKGETKDAIYAKNLLKELKKFEASYINIKLFLMLAIKSRCLFRTMLTAKKMRTCLSLAKGAGYFGSPNANN